MHAQVGLAGFGKDGARWTSGTRYYLDSYRLLSVTVDAVSRQQSHTTEVQPAGIFCQIWRVYCAVASLGSQGSVSIGSSWRWNLRLDGSTFHPLLIVLLFSHGAQSVGIRGLEAWSLVAGDLANGLESQLFVWREINGMLA